VAPLVSTIEIARPPDEVFAYVTDPLHFAEWQNDVVSVRMLAGSRFTTTRRIRGAERTMTQQITRNDPPRGTDSAYPSCRWYAGRRSVARPPATTTSRSSSKADERRDEG
jgi:hypothetical protein